MKKQQRFESFEEIVFKGRNHNYGAYFLRKRYRKNLSVAMTLSIFFLAIAVAFPLVGAYLNKGNLIRSAQLEVGVNIENLKPEDLPPPPPPPPPAPEQMVERVKFVAPVVVDDSTAGGIGLQEDFNNVPSQPPPSGNEIEIIPDQNPSPSVLDEPKKTEIFTVVEEQPSFPGGEESRIAFLQQNIKYPEEAKELGIQGRVFVTYVVEADGSITDIRVLRGIGGGCDEEAIRVVSIMPKWIPGKQRGTPVRVQFNLPIKFTLQ